MVTESISERRVYHVAPRADESWQVLRNGFRRPHIVRDSKAEAILVAKRLAQAEPGAVVIIYTRDNDVERELSYSLGRM